MTSATRRDAARQALALASVGAGAIHLALGPEHMSEWALLGTGFYLSGVFQLAWGAWAAVTESRRLLAVGAAGSLLFLGAWLVSRTSGLPFGPEAWQPEAVGRADLLCVALEAVVAVGALTLLRRPTAGLAPAGRVAVRGLLSAVALAVLATTGVAVAAPTQAHGGNSSCAASTVAGHQTQAQHDAAHDLAALLSCQQHGEHAG
jgi:hypothetical protein